MNDQDSQTIQKAPGIELPASPELPTILIVDDSPIDRRLMTRLLEAGQQFRLLHAEDGIEALATLQTNTPAAVVTDLQMPNMNGLELLQEIGERFPTLPVVVITARGSEQLAVEAIESGAASYVPKARLAEDLATTLSRILSSQRGVSISDRVYQSLVSTEALYELPCDPEVLTASGEMVYETIQRNWNCTARDAMRMRMTLEEALLNALYHGSLELDPELRANDLQAYHRQAHERQHTGPWKDRRIKLRISCTPNEFVMEVADEGNGFDAAPFMDLTEETVLERPYGRGILLMRTVMDEVTFRDGGRVTRLVKRRDSLSSPTEDTPADNALAGTDLSDSAFMLDLGDDEEDGLL
ncbi:MAG: ATP-binding protein [Planctomycetota bacterium]|jgi:CheY-like chemotaxis protein/anti-sigma regulatory factor (Ser/Thr protein kinase)